MVAATVEYGRVKLEEILVRRPETDKAPDDPLNVGIEIDGELLQSSDRFWKSFFARFGISQTIFRYYSHAEVFSRIAERSNDSTIRYCVSRSHPDEPGRLLGVTRPGKSLITYQAALEVLHNHQPARLDFDGEGIITSEHVPLSGRCWYDIGPDRFAHRYQLRTPVDGYGLPQIHLMVVREVCTNGMVGFTPAFRSELAGGSNLAFSIDRALASFDNGDGYSAFKDRLAMAQESWASVREANKLYRLIATLSNSRDLQESTALSRFHTVTGDIGQLYGLASLESLSAKQQQTLPCDCRVMDLLNLASELSTHHATPGGAGKFDVFCGSLLSCQYDLEGTAEQIPAFADFFLDHTSQN